MATNGTVNVTPKPWYMSLTLWMNIILGILGNLPMFKPVVEANPGAVMGVASAANVALRVFKTNAPIV